MDPMNTQDPEEICGATAPGPGDPAYWICVDPPHNHPDSKADQHHFRKRRTNR
jgi:hypothetical protein